LDIITGCPAPSDIKLGQILGQYFRNFRAKIRNFRVHNRDFRAKFWNVSTKLRPKKTMMWANICIFETKEHFLPMFWECYNHECLKVILLQ
jgi:hypothetical protein